MAMYCHDPACADVEYDDFEYQCSEHTRELVPNPPPARNGGAAPPPAAETADPTGSARSAGPSAHPSGAAHGRPWSTDTCWSCRAATPNRENTHCLECLEPLVPPRLVLTWTTGSVRLDPEESVRLGRAGPHARTFAGYPNVSREHATVGVDPDGTAWIEPLPNAINGTFRPGDPETELFPGSRYDLRDGQTVRFARDATATVAVFALPDR